MVRLGKERKKERSVLLKRTEKNGKNGTFFYKDRKRTERTEHSFIKKGKERNVLLKRTDAQTWILSTNSKLDREPE